MYAVLVHPNAGTAQGFLFAAAAIFVLAFIVEAMSNAGAPALLSTAALCLLSLGLVWATGATL